MEVTAKLKPGQEGTRRLVRTYGERLVCVRYRLDRAAGKRYKTVEIIVDEQPWTPGVRVARSRRAAREIPGDVLVRIAYAESALRETVKAARGRWVPSEKRWRLPYEKAIALKLCDRIVRHL